MPSKRDRLDKGPANTCVGSIVQVLFEVPPPKNTEGIGPALVDSTSRRGAPEGFMTGDRTRQKFVAIGVCRCSMLPILGGQNGNPGLDIF